MGCNRRILLPLYSTFVRSTLDYGPPVYGLAPPTQLKLLDPVQNAALRIVTGSFRTSPASSLCAETGVPPLHYRRLTLTAKFLTTVLQHPKTNAYNYIFNPSPAIQSNNNLRTHLELQLNRTFKFQVLNPILSVTPPWLFTPPTVNLSLTQHSKNSTPSSIFNSLFHELIRSTAQLHVSRTAQKPITEQDSHV